MADWSHETRRYIYRTPDPKWLTLPASTRALAAELLRWVDDDGALYLRADEKPWQGVARIIQAPRSDVAWVKRATDLLVEDEHLVVEDDRVLIRNFKVAQGIVESAEALSQRRSREAERKARWRASRRDNGGAEWDTAGHVPRDRTGHVPRDNGTGSRAPAPARGAHASPDGRAGAPAHSVPFPAVPPDPPPSDPGGRRGSLERDVVEILRVELAERYNAIASPFDLALSLLNKARVDGDDAPDRREVIREAAHDVGRAKNVSNVESLLRHKVEQYRDPLVLARVVAARKNVVVSLSQRTGTNSGIDLEHEREMKRKLIAANKRRAAEEAAAAERDRALDAAEKAGRE